MINEKILRIEEGEDDGYAGFFIETDKQVIQLLISDGQQCCESWGYFLSEEDPSTFVGATILEMYVTDTSLKDYDFGDLEDGEVMFVSFDTDKGKLQFAAYNSHNGYYGHTAKIVSKQLNHEEDL